MRFCVLRGNKKNTPEHDDRPRSTEEFGSLNIIKYGIRNHKKYKEVVKYIHYYNNDRIKLRLNGKSPVKYRALFQSKSAS